MRFGYTEANADHGCLVTAAYYRPLTPAPHCEVEKWIPGSKRRMEISEANSTAITTLADKLGSKCTYTRTRRKQI